MTCASPIDGVRVAWRTLWAVTATCAVVVALVPGAAEGARAWFDFSLALADGSLTTALDGWQRNARAVAFILLAALVRPRLRALDVLVGALVLANVALVGAALGAHGPQLVPWLAHVPLEWAALSLALGPYLAARHTVPMWSAIAAAGASAAAMLAAAAAIETWATPAPGPWR